MVQSKKIKIAGWLMVSSIGLLLLFQTYWLRKTYRDEFFSLRRELSLILRETTVRRQLQRVMTDARMVSRPDSTREVSGIVAVIKADSSQQKPPVRWEMAVSLKSDSGKNRRNARVVTFDPDRRNDATPSTKRMVVMAPVFWENPNLKNLDSLYRKALLENEIDLDFTLRKLNKRQIDSLLKHEPLRMSMMRRGGPMPPNVEMLEADFSNPVLAIIPKMWGPIFFSLLMMGITITAFLFLYRSLKAQHRLAVLKNDFISNITHELKTPIATVGVAIEALKSFNAMNDPQRTREYLDISGNELQRLGLLVDKVLRISMFEQDKMELRQEPLDMESLVREVVQSMKLQFDKAGADVSVETDGKTYPVTGDRLHLLSVLYNLIDNALKYSNGQPTIRISLQQEAQQVKLAVQDNGVGIPAEYRSKVFDKFFRVPHGDTHNIKGYGLGLSYVAEVVKKHGGTITAAPAPVKGSIFIVTFPAATTAA